MVKITITDNQRCNKISGIYPDVKFASDYAAIPLLNPAIRILDHTPIKLNLTLLRNLLGVVFSAQFKVHHFMAHSSQLRMFNDFHVMLPIASTLHAS